jgi:hypothetical protein
MLILFPDGWRGRPFDNIFFIENIEEGEFRWIVSSPDFGDVIIQKKRSSAFCRK